MDINSSCNTLRNMFKDQDWFFDVGVDSFNRAVVYVKYMCHSTLHNIPNFVNGHHVLVHFASSNTASKDQYTLTDKKQNTVKSISPESEDDFDLPGYSDVAISDLVQELDRLEKICGSNILQDIFFEIHDGVNAVTNLSSKFPEVRGAMSELYNSFGFDVIYEELDG